MAAFRHVAVPAVATLALVSGTLWLVQSGPRVVDMPDQEAIRKASAPKPKGARLRCDPDELVADAPPGSAERRLEGELYRVIVSAYPRIRADSQLVVEQVSIPMPRVHGAEWFKDWSPAAFALIAPGFFQCSALSADRFPPAAHLAPVSEIAGDWNRLASRFNGARLWYAFSRARVKETTGDAVVYYDQQCRDGCGVGEWVWFHRDAIDAPWRIAGTRWSWIQ